MRDVTGPRYASSRLLVMVLLLSTRRMGSTSNSRLRSSTSRLGSTSTSTSRLRTTSNYYVWRHTPVSRLTDSLIITPKTPTPPLLSVTIHFESELMSLLTVTMSVPKEGNGFFNLIWMLRCSRVGSAVSLIWPIPNVISLPEHSGIVNPSASVKDWKNGQIHLSVQKKYTDNGHRRPQHPNIYCHWQWPIRLSHWHLKSSLA